MLKKKIISTAIYKFRRKVTDEKKSLKKPGKTTHRTSPQKLGKQEENRVNKVLEGQKWLTRTLYPANILKNRLVSGP